VLLVVGDCGERLERADIDLIEEVAVIDVFAQPGVVAFLLALQALNLRADTGNTFRIIAIVGISPYICFVPLPPCLAGADFRRGALGIAAPGVRRLPARGE
jgi:hypothetical protein